MTTQDLAKDVAKSKPVRRKSTPRPDAWYKRYPEDYKRGTRKLSLAARGAYSDILDMMYMEDGPIVDDDFAIACELRVKMRQWLSVRKELFAAGKLVSENGRISNPKAEEVLAEREAAKRAAQVRKHPRVVLGEFSRVAERCGNNVATEKLFQGKVKEINGGCTTEAEAELEADRNSIIKVAASTLPPTAEMNSKVLSAMLMDAAGDCLANPAAAPGLLSMLVPQMWLDQGCSLEKDILPTLRAIAARPRRQKIIAWTYFNKAMSEAKAIREEGLPTVHRETRNVPASRQPHHMQELEECRAVLAAG